jgi:hypothetical protein
MIMHIVVAIAVCDAVEVSAATALYFIGNRLRRS